MLEEGISLTETFERSVLRGSTVPLECFLQIVMQRVLSRVEKSQRRFSFDDRFVFVITGG